MATCYIACAIDCNIKISKNKGDLIIGADRGYSVLEKNGIRADIAIGDFDSYDGKIDCKVLKFPVRKDYTDCALAIEYAIEKNYKKIRVFGAIGGKIEHTLANIALCALYAKKGMDIAFFTDTDVIFAVCNGKVAFSEECTGKISVFSYTDKSDGVCEKNLSYTLDNVMLDNTVPLGISNEFVGKQSEISVKDGIIVIVTSRENFEKRLTI